MLDPLYNKRLMDYHKRLPIGVVAKGGAVVLLLSPVSPVPRTLRQPYSHALPPSTWN
jgi:hypothetical protein